MVHPPLIERTDSKLTSLIPFDGYGDDTRERLSGV